MDSEFKWNAQQMQIFLDYALETNPVQIPFTWLVGFGFFFLIG